MNFKWLILILLFVWSCEADEETSKNSFVQLPFTNAIEDSKELNILTYLYFYNGAGVAVGNVVGDQLPDIYLVNNQGQNKLFENLGNLQFKDVTEVAKVGGKADWQTGTAMVDINGDHLLDIFVASVNDIHGFKGHNEVYINQGDGTFVEQSELLGLNQSDFSTAFSFFDYDLDGDLDLYLLNHAVHTEDGYRLQADEIRTIISDDAGDRLLRNDGGVFIDVSNEAGILRSKVSYGLAVKASDLNKDGWPDLYVSNDFHENDYIYINQGDGRFALQTDQLLSYTTKYSMGNDIADVNNDNWPDVFVADMEPWEAHLKKTTQGEDAPQIFAFKQNFGYARQYSRNTLQLSHEGNRFFDVAQQYGVSATDWSWSPILEDFNQDGRMDLFVSNGILRRPNDLDFLNYVSGQEIQNQIRNNAEYDLEIIQKMPSGLVQNQMFFQSEHGFANQSNQLGFVESDSSTGVATADFDGDGDLDLVINRVNDKATIWENKNTKQNQSFLLRFFAPSEAYGLKAILATHDQQYYRELYPQKGFMSSSEPILHFGIGSYNGPLSLFLEWPNGTKETIDLPEGAREFTLPQNQNKYILPTAKPIQKETVQTKFDPKAFINDPLVPFKDVEKTAVVVSTKDYIVKAEPFSKQVYIEMNGAILTTTTPSGFWQTAAVFDKDSDGDLDILLGNIGENNRFYASADAPLRLYQADYDGNGVQEAIWAVKEKNDYIPLYDKDALAKQLAFLNREFSDYQSFAGKSMEEIFSQQIKDVELFEIETLQSGWLIQNNGSFHWEPLPFELQQGPITNIKVLGDGTCEVRGDLDIFVPYIGYLELPKTVWKDGRWNTK